MRVFGLIALLMLAPALFAQNPADEEEADTTAKKEPVKGFQFKFKDRPSFRYGEYLRMDVKSKWHIDFRHFSPEIPDPLPSQESFTITRARVGLKGEVTKYFEYEVERDFRGALVDDHPRHPWKDVYGDFQPLDEVRFKAGKFKVPFGMEENTSEDRLDFVTRSQVTDYLAPGRERGAMLHGKLFKGKRIAYEAGVFRYDGENSEAKGIPTAGRTYAFRVSGEPLRYVKLLPKTIRHTYLGVAATQGEMFEGQNSIHGQTVSNLTYFDHLFVKGDRRRTGVELAYSEGPFGLKAEYIHVSEQRKQQGIRDNDIPDKISRGWYVTTSWVVLGKMKSKGNEPKDPFLTGKGFGAVELAARLDVLTFYGAEQTGIPSRSPRAATILPNSDRTWTFGSTWYLNHFAKIQANAEREWLADIGRESAGGRRVFWSGIVRLQFAM